MKTIEDIMTREKFVNCMLHNLHSQEYNSYGYSAQEECLACLYEMLYDEDLAEMYENFISNMPYGEDFFKLAEIGGCRQYHREGNALEHTLLVAAHMWTEFYSPWAFEVGILHDIGKIYTGIPKADGSGDWEYPWHSIVGGIPGILQRFISKEHPLFKAYSWFITNHIKPLFWVNKSQEELQREIDTLLKSVPKGHEELCTIENLVTLVLCDLKGSIGEDSNEETINFLNNLKQQTTMEEIKKLTKIMTGIYTIHADSDWYREECECYILVLNGEYYLAYVDPDDGYRSYAGLTCLGDGLPVTVKIATTVPVDQDVYLEEVEFPSRYEFADGPTRATQICNANTHETIMEIGTNYEDSYYPIGYVHYYPEELDANRKK